MSSSAGPAWPTAATPISRCARRSPGGGERPARPARPARHAPRRNLAAADPAAEVPGVLSFHRLQVLRRLPHPGLGFTQGLIVAGDTVWESTGLYGQSSLRRYRLGAGRWEACAPLPPELFAEGICLAGETIWQLTWRERTALR